MMDFNSRRSPVLGMRGMVACTQPLAAEVLCLEGPGNACTLIDVPICFWATAARFTAQLLP